MNREPLHLPPVRSLFGEANSIAASGRMAESRREGSLRGWRGLAGWVGWFLALSVLCPSSSPAQSRQFSQVAQSPVTLTPEFIFAADGRLFGLSRSGEFLQSSNGLNWIATPRPGNGFPTRLIRDGGRFLSLTAEFPFRSSVWTSTDGTNWTFLSDVGGSADAYGFAFGNGVYVATGGFGVYTSTNAIDWQSRTTSTNVTLTSVTYGDGLFVAAGWDENLGAVVYSSPDGRTWTRRRSAIDDSYDEVCYGAGRFVIAGGRWSGDTLNNLVLTSSSGTSWSAIPLANEGALYSVVFGNGRFVAVGEEGSVAVSTNGTTWSGRALPPRAILGQSPRLDALWSVGFAAGGFVAASDRGDIVTSVDGRGWVDQTGAFSPWLSDLAYGNGLYVAAGPDGVWISGDGIVWANVLSDSEVSYEAVAFGGGRFVLVGGDLDANSNSRSALFQSTDGVTWTRTRAVTFEEPREVTFGGGRFVVVGERTDASENPFNLVLRSSDGVSWARAGSVPENHELPGLYDVAYNGTNFVAVGEDGVVLTSPNGDTWTERNLGSDTPLYRIAYGGGQFCAFGDGLFRSVDGMAWQPVNAAAVSNASSVVFAGGAFLFPGTDEVVVSADLQTWQRSLVQTPHLGTYLFGGASSGRLTVVVGQSGTVITSTNLVQWTRQAVSRQPTLRAMTSGAGRFVAVGEPGTFATSTDGMNWEFQTRPPLDFLATIAHGNGRFVALGPPGMEWVSSDGLNWNLLTNTISAPVTDVAFGLGQFAAISTVGRIFTSVDGLNWILQTSGTTISLTSILATPAGFVAVGSMGTVLTSSNGSTWELRPLGTNAELTGLTFGLGQLVAVGTPAGDFAGVVFTSTDGSAWTQSPAGFGWPQSIAYGEGGFVALGNVDRVQAPARAFSSSNGLSWRAASPASLGAVKVVYLDQAFYAVGPSGRVYRSEGRPNPRLGIARSPDGQITVSLTGIPGASYRIQSQAQLGQGLPWESVSFLAMTSAVQTIIVTPPSASSRYFRAERVIP